MANDLAWLSDELRGECSQPVLQRARGIANQWRVKMNDLYCLNDPESSRITLRATVRGTTSPSSRYEVQATLDMEDELFLARYCSCPAFGSSQRGYGTGRLSGYRNRPGYRSFDDGADDDYDDYDYVDDYDDFGSGVDFGHATFGHAEADGSSADTSMGGRYTGMCKHVAALLLLFLDQPERFHGFQRGSATPRDLADYMRSIDARNDNAGEGAQLRMLKRIANAKTRLADEQRGAAGGGASRPKRASAGPVTVTPGSVRLEPTLARTRDAWSLSLRIACGGAGYVLKGISKFVSDMRSGAYEAYGRKLAFTHTPDMLDPFSAKLLGFLEQVISTRRIAQMQTGVYYAPEPRVDRELMLADGEVCDLLDMYHAVTQEDYRDKELKARGFLAAGDVHGLQRIVIDDIVRERQAAPSRIHFVDDGPADIDVDIIEGDPEFRLSAEYVREGNASGVRVTANRTINAIITGRRNLYILSAEHIADPDDSQEVAIDGFFRCTDGLRPALHALRELCDGDPDGVFISENDWPMFARTIVPQLNKAGIGLDIPQEVAEQAGSECRIEYYLDRDLHGITCEAVARYGDFLFQLVPTSKELRGTINPDPRSKAAQVKRDVARESFAVQVARQLFPTWSSIDVARIREEDEQSILLMLTDGVDILRSVGSVFSTAAFDGMMQPGTPTVKVGLSVDSNLVEISPIADEVPMNEVGALLESYRRKRRYHRLKNGTFVDLRNADLSELDHVAADLDLDERQLDSGTITVPGYQAFLLDAQVRDDGKSDSFDAYVNDVKIIDPKRYSVPDNLKTVLRPYQVEGFQWLSTLWDKGFGGILADEMGLGKSVQLLALIEARRGSGPALIVCPASLVYNWAAECEKFAGDLTVEVIAGTKAQRRKSIAGIAVRNRPQDDSSTPAPDVVITSYDLLRRDVDDYADCRFALMALDEAQYIKNHATKVAKAVKRITAEHRFALTGTPIENRLSELWSIFDFLMPGLLGTYTKFREKYEQPIMAPGPEHSVMADKLQALVGLFIKRRLKKDVLTDLPEKIENVLTVRLEGEQRKLYAAHEQRLRATLTKTKDADFNTKKIRILAEFTLLREICCDPRLVYADAKNASAKLDAIVQLVDTCMDEGKKVLVFSQFTSFLELIGTRLAERDVAFYTITGETPKKRRVELVDDFNGDDVPVFLISLKAGNTGLNLVGASVVIHADPWWNAAAQNQATDRAHRIGQKQDVNVYQIVAKDTIEERILNMQEKKNELARQFTDGAASGGVGTLSKDDLLALLS